MESTHKFEVYFVEMSLANGSLAKLAAYLHHAGNVGIDDAY